MKAVLRYEKQQKDWWIPKCETRELPAALVERLEERALTLKCSVMDLVIVALKKAEGMEDKT